MPGIDTQIPGFVYSIPCVWNTSLNKYVPQGSSAAQQVPTSTVLYGQMDGPGGAAITRPLLCQNPYGSAVTAANVKYAALSTLGGGLASIPSSGFNNFQADLSFSPASLMGIPRSAYTSVYPQTNVGVRPGMNVALDAQNINSATRNLAPNVYHTGAEDSGVVGFHTALTASMANQGPTDVDAKFRVVMDSSVAVDPTNTAGGFVKAVGLVGSSNSRQFLAKGSMPTPGVSPSVAVGAIRGNLASDGVSTQMCTTTLDTVVMRAADGKAAFATTVAQEGDGKPKVSVYGSNGSNSLSVTSDGAMDKIGTVANVVTAAVSVANSTTEPALVKLVDGTGASVGVTNGALSMYVTDPNSSNPVTVTQTGAGTSAQYHLSVSDSVLSGVCVVSAVDAKSSK